MILVITRKNDLHAERVIQVLESIGEKASPIDFSFFPTKLEMSFEFYRRFHGRKADFFITLPNGDQVCADSIKSILNRRKSEPVPPESVIKPEFRDYIIKESESFLAAFYKMTNCFWLNSPHAVDIANQKPYQLQLASKLGFTTPPTLITNSPERAKIFVEQFGPILAVKTISSTGIRFVDDDGKEKRFSLYTKKLSRQKVLSALTRIKNCPTIFQKYIEKKFELRITVVGERVFACAIYSQESDRTREDWRRYDLPNTPHKIFALPGDIEDKCVLLVKELGLSFGCIDLIVTPNDEYVFLEINPNGQWLWIEQLTGLPITRSIAELLCNS